MDHPRFLTSHAPRPTPLVVGLGIGLSAVVLATVGGVAGHIPDLSSSMSVVNSVADSVAFAIAQGYAAAPALMLGVAAALALPLLGAASAIKRRVTRDDAATRRYRGKPLDHIMTVSDDVSDDGAASPSSPKAWSAFVETVGGPDRRFTIERDMLRIGREVDNDIRLSNHGVHRYHAAIYREDRVEWHITDLSGIEGNGVVVNGERCGGAQLRDGDVFDLGPGRFRFRIQRGLDAEIDNSQSPLVGS